MTRLPTVEEASNMIQQEESQREIFSGTREERTGLAMNTRKGEGSCSNCGRSNHTTEQC